jgi:hypothetical protein
MDLTVDEHVQDEVLVAVTPVVNVMLGVLWV